MGTAYDDADDADGGADRHGPVVKQTCAFWPPRTCVHTQTTFYTLATHTHTIGTFSFPRVIITSTLHASLNERERERRCTHAFVSENTTQANSIAR